MKRIIILLTSSILTVSAFSQQAACKHDTINFFQAGYRGILTWQTSANGTDWTPMAGTQKDTISIIADGTAYYRTQIIEGLCKPVYSEVVYLIVNEVPQVKLSLKDSTCVNSSPFVLNGGIPSGGSYWGDGVYDSKYWPSEAGPGVHKVYYRYRNPLTNCADTAFALIVVEDLVNKAHAGTDVPFIAADSVMLEANTADNGIGTWSIVSGKHGHFSNIHSSKTWFIKDSTNLNFTLRWSITGKCSSSTDDVEVAFFQLSKHPCPGAPTMTDTDGNIYPTVQIGNQCWMGKNLNVGRFVMSTKSSLEHSDLSNNGIIEKYCLFNSADSCKLYGGLYDFDEAMGYVTTEGAKGICPDGWHIPSYEEWDILDRNFVFNIAGEVLKVNGPTGFDGYFAGSRNELGDFYSNGSSAFFWVSGTWLYDTLVEGYIRKLADCNGMIGQNHFPRKTGISVRCIKNNN
jgi:uncharacterized protein (TIGR02145 family)